MGEETVFQQLTVYPNPARGMATVEFDLIRQSAVRICVVNAMGAVVVRLPESMLEAGKHRVPIDLSAVSSGLYLCRVQQAGRVLQQKLLLTK